MHISTYFLSGSFLCNFTWKFQNNSSFLCHLVFSGSIGLFLSLHGPMLSHHCSAETSGYLFPTQGLCPPVYIRALRLPRLILSQVPLEPLLWQIPFGLTGPRGGAVGATWQGPPIPHIRSNLQTALGGSSSPARTGCSCSPPHCLREWGAFPQLTCLWVERCEKLRDKNGFYRRRGSFLVQKGRKYLCGILFPRPFIQKIQRHSLSLMRMSALNLLGLD